jgi:recombination protein RecR
VYAESVETLIRGLKSLPGIGRKTAERLAFHILVSEDRVGLGLADAIRDMKKRVHPCSRCFNIAETEICPICADDRRDNGLVCVVEQPRDVLAIERAGLYRGVYHVLLGVVSPLEGVGEDDLTIGSLQQRVKDEEIREIILATSPTTDGDMTAMLIGRRLAKSKVPVSRIARGLPTGSDLEKVSKAILADAIETRRRLQEDS